jgi:hypothetical protein
MTCIITKTVRMLQFYFICNGTAIYPCLLTCVPARCYVLANVLFQHPLCSPHPSLFTQIEHLADARRNGVALNSSG